jgi:hypothetical protein
MKSTTLVRTKRVAPVVFAAILSPTAMVKDIDPYAIMEQ